MQRLFALFLRQSCLKDFDQLREAKVSRIRLVSNARKLLWIAGMRRVVCSLRLGHLHLTAQARRTNGGNTILHKVFSIDHG